MTTWGFAMPLAIVIRPEYPHASQRPGKRILCSRCRRRGRPGDFQAFRSIYLDMVWLARFGTRPLANGTRCMYCNKELINNMCYRKLMGVHGAGSHLKFCCTNCYHKYVSDEDWVVVLDGWALSSLYMLWRILIELVLAGSRTEVVVCSVMRACVFGLVWHIHLTNWVYSHDMTPAYRFLLFIP